MNDFLLDKLSSAERERLLQLARAAKLKRKTTETAPVPPAVRDQPLPLSFAQQRLWFLSQFDGTGEAYHIPGGLRLRGRLDHAALRRALDRIVARHEALRTTFVEIDGQPMQRIAAADAGFPLQFEDLCGVADAEAALQRAAAAEAGTPFDLAAGPLLRGRLLHLADDDHALLVTMHHIVSDGWSMGVLIDELGRLYTAFCQGRPDPLPALPIQYADYAVWQRQWLQGDVLQRQAGYWQAALRGAPVLLELPGDRGRPAVQDHAGATVELQLDRALTEGLKALSQRHQTTLFMTLLAGWGALLARLSGQDDVVIGSPVAHRGRAELEPLIGLFVNTLALRIDTSGAPTVTDLLARVKTQVLGAQQHQDLPFEQVVDLMRPPRSLAHAPLFQVMLAWQNTPEGHLELPGLQLETLSAPQVTAQFDLSLTLQEADGCIVGGIDYATALFERTTIERHLGHWMHLLRAMCAGENRRIDLLPLFDAEERRRLLEEGNQTVAPYPQQRCVHELFEAQAAAAPDAVALRYAGRALRYGELNAAANRLAHQLRTLGVGPDQRVAVCAERGFPLLTGLLAILKAGGAYVPLDPGYPADRLAFQLDDCAPVVLLADAAGAAALAGRALAMPVLDLNDAAGWAGQPDTNLPAVDLGLTPQHLAYVIYTSGSTGLPKGVQVPHRGLVNHISWQTRSFGFTAADAILQRTPIAFDASVWELWTPLAIGARLVLLPNADAKDPAAMAALIRAEQVSIVQFVPSLLEVMLPTAGAAVPFRCRYVFCGGEPLSASLAQRARPLVTEAVVNLYGPTEATIDATFWRCDGEAQGRIPIGRPIANTRLYLLDAQGEPVPQGVVGELYIGGAGVARGYLNRPQLTAERFVADRFGGDPQARLYRTGDLGRLRPDGTFEFLGRNDHQVKLRGFRIELGEIEAQLAGHPAVREAVVLAHEAAGGPRLTAWYLPRPEHAAPAADELRQHLAARLPDYMIPSALVALDAWPLTPNGKLDRRALPEPDAVAGGRPYAAPVGPFEARVAVVWAELLKCGPVGRDDHFFELGGHSLLVVQVVSRLRQLLGIEVNLADLFARPRLADFAAHLAGVRQVALPPISPAPRDGAPPLSFAQQRLWFLAQFEGVSEAYHMPAGLRLRGPLDRMALRRALDTLVARHESLRTTVAVVDGQPVQRIGAADAGFPLQVVDLQGTPDAERELLRMAAAQADAPFDLATGPLVRGRLIRLADGDHALLVTLHHIVSDGWSMGVLIDELSQLYAAFHQDRSDPLPALPIQYADYAVWQRQWLQGEVLQHQADYWQQTLAGAPALLELPSDRPRPAVQDYAGSVVELQLDPVLTERLKTLSQRHQTTLYMTLLAGWAALLSRLSGQDEVVIGSPVANRGRAELEPLIGFFVNTLALRIDTGGAPTVAELLARVKARVLGAQQHQDLPFEQVVERLQPQRSLAHAPLFQVMLSWQNTPEGRLELPGLAAETITAPHVTAQFDLSLALQESSGCIVGSVEYATALFERSTIERYMGHWKCLLAAMAGDDGQAVGRLPLLQPAERRRLLEQWNDTAAPYPQDRCVHELVEARAAATPDAVAVRHQGRSLSYGELNASANRLAHHLRGLGVGPDRRVAVCAERGFPLVSGLLAILKAGGAYVPFDPAYPAQRLADQLDDCAPAALLTDALGTAALAGATRTMPTIDLAATDRWAGQPATDLPAAGLGLTPDHLAYVIYTSGSTGRPKGVLVPHRGLVNHIAWQRGAFGITAEDAVLQRTPIAFDASVWELWTPLATGGRLVLLPDAAAKDAAAMAELIAAEQVSIVQFVPSLLEALLPARLEDLPFRCRYVFCGGEPLSAALVERVRPLVTEAVVNLYGPTETTIDATAWRCDGEPAAPVPIGRPIANTRVHLLDAYGEPVPPGVAGEVFIGGAGVARGYLNRSELTAQHFVADPFGDAPNARLYRTGDLARRRADGAIEFLGRNDHQVKLRGFRIELGDIEAQLAAHPGVREAVVRVREETGTARLVAYWLPQPGSDPPEPGVLRQHLAARLPDYMVPAAFVALDAWPLTPNGKLDRQALPAPQTLAAAAYVPPSGAQETRLAAIWAEVLRLPQVGVESNFFTLGGNSIRAMQVVARCRQAGLPIAIRDLYAAQTVRQLAAAVEAPGTTPEAALES